MNNNYNDYVTRAVTIFLAIWPDRAREHKSPQEVMEEAIECANKLAGQ